MKSLNTSKDGELVPRIVFSEWNNAINAFYKRYLESITIAKYLEIEEYTYASK